MDDLDLVVQGGTVVTGSDRFRCDVGIRNGRIVALADGLSGRETVDATDRLVLPGGVDTHCHIEQFEPDGSVHVESFETASRSAFLGGTTSAICFLAQFKGHALSHRLGAYRARASRSMMDYGFHQIITDPTDTVLHEELPALIEAGIRSIKVFLAYDPLRLDDAKFLRVLSAARRYGALVSVHCENYDAIAWRTRALLQAGLTGPGFHAWSRPTVVEREATYRAIALAELVDQPIQIFHVSAPEVAEEIARAQRRGVKVWAETCPQYLVLTADDMARGGIEGAKFICSPSPRDVASQEGLWADIRSDTIGVVSSDHCGFLYNGHHGKRINGDGAAFPDIPNGIPGLATRLPLLFSEGVSQGRIDVTRFVRLVATNPAKLFGLYPRKGTIAPGSDADLVLWDPSRAVTITNALLGHAIDYTPYEGHRVVGWPVCTIANGRVVMRDGVVTARPGDGRFLARNAYEMIRPSGHVANGFET